MLISSKIERFFEYNPEINFERRNIIFFDNNGSIDDLFAKVKDLVSDPLDANERPLYVGLADNLHTLT